MQGHKIINISEADPALSKRLSKELGIPGVLAQLLINRGINTEADGQKFLNAGMTDMLDPFSFEDMPIAVRLVKNAIKRKERIMVFGDYDADGITSLAVLKDTLRKMGADVVHYIPHRIREGYGLNKNIPKLALEKQVKLLITSDCGTNSAKEISELRKHAIEVIITDHHEPETESSGKDASALINPKSYGSNYRFRDLAGVGVAYKLCQALSGQLMEKDLDLVCLGTIADSVPLLGENRIIAKEGLPRISRTERPGLKSLLGSSGIIDRQITSDFVSFILAPRINASGRLDTAETAVELLLSEDILKAQDLAKTIESFNRQRQKIETDILKQAQDLIDKEINFKEHKVMVLAGEGWHVGVLGIVAAKLAERFYRPAILISMNEGLCRGSGRSIKNFHLFSGLLECKELLDNFGGHKHAVGMVISQDNIQEFKNRINHFARQSMRLQDLVPSIDVDMELALSDLKNDVMESLADLEPFGSGNPAPLFYTRDLKLKGRPRVMGRETLKFWVTDGNLTFPAIGFGMAALEENLLKAGAMDLVYTPRIDSWQGQESWILEIKDMFFK